jgi:hypothetical protein
VWRACCGNVPLSVAQQSTKVKCLSTMTALAKTTPAAEMSKMANMKTITSKNVFNVYKPWQSACFVALSVMTQIASAEAKRNFRPGEAIVYEPLDPALFM